MNSGEQEMVPGNGQSAGHVPVLLAEVLQALEPLKGAHIVDGTFGAGGYTRALLKAGARVTAIDRDPGVSETATAIAAEFPAQFTFVEGTFSNLDTLVATPVDALTLDLGVSSMQLDQPERGFSFLRDGPLDMRMGKAGPSASDLVNQLTENDLAGLLFAYGEERKSRRIAAAIVTARATAPIATTSQLSALIEKTIGRRPGQSHPATKSFQALRIAVNAEFDELVGALFAAERALGEGGRLAVVTFHSLEDRIVKRFLSAEKTGPTRSRHLPQALTEAPGWQNVARPVRASDREVAANARARSATLRSATRTASAARETSIRGLGVPGFKAGGAA